MTHWSTRFVGQSFETLGNCWGLVRHVYADVLTIPVTDYGIDAAAHDAIAEAIGAAKGGPVWFTADAPHEFDLAIFRRGRLETHVGIVVSTDQMLHIAHDHPARIERFTTGAWSSRLTGFWRHVDLGGGHGA